MKAKTRRKLKKSQFGLPGKRKYPMPDKAHAVNAKARAKQQRKRGKLSKSAYEKIVAKANKVIRRSKQKTNALARSGLPERARLGAGIAPPDQLVDVQCDPDGGDERKSEQRRHGDGNRP